MTTTLTILGCGSSGGVPRPGGDWGACDPEEPKNLRRRCSVLVERVGVKGTTRVLIDTSPDLRAQLLDANVPDLDAVIYSHDHADHVHGIDDLRPLVIRNRRRISVYAEGETHRTLMHRFGYCFQAPEGSIYPPILDLTEFSADAPLVINGAGGEIAVTPIPVIHGPAPALGFRFGDVVYMPDVSDIPETSLPLLDKLETWIIDSLRRTPHVSHFNLEDALAWIERIAPKHAILTNLHVDMDYATLLSETPEHVTVAYDMRHVPIS